MNITRRSLFTLALVLLLTFSVFAAGQTEAKASATYKIGVSKLLPHPALDAAEKGLMDHLATTGLSVSFDLQNANGDISTASSIAQKLKSDKVDVAVGFAHRSGLAQFSRLFRHPGCIQCVTDCREDGLGCRKISPVFPTRNGR
jgi:putative ABC transport system substrate-binding protein